jgi:hypothetical protein
VRSGVHKRDPDRLAGSRRSPGSTSTRPTRASPFCVSGPDFSGSAPEDPYRYVTACRFSGMANRGW